MKYSFFPVSVGKEEEDEGIEKKTSITCGVCGAVRYYTHIKQTRKFKIHSCESCRKLITRCIRSVRSGTPNTRFRSSFVCSGNGKNIFSFFFLLPFCKIDYNVH